MESAKRDMNDIWNKLKTQRHKQQSKAFDKLWQGFSSDIAHNKTTRPPAGLSSRELQFYLQKPADKQHATHNVASSQPSSYQFSEQVEKSALDRLVKSLTSSDASTRKAALHQIKAAYVSDTASGTPVEAGNLAAVAAGVLPSKLGKSLLRRFDDPVEGCRELAATIFKHLSVASPDATLPMLPYAMPVLEERLHLDESNHEPSEPSEEIRLLLVQLLSVILDQAGTAIAAYASEVWSMLSAALADSYHEVAMQGCKVAQQLTGILGLRLGSTAKDIVAALLPLTTHKRHKVRIAAIEAIRDVVHQGAHEIILEMVAWRDPNVVPIKAFYGDDLKVNYCGKLATDHHVQVRLAFLQMIGNWMLTLRERTDHEARLLPYLLSGLCDESPAVVKSALQLLDQLGQQYEQEHEKDLADFLRFSDAAQDAAEAKFAEAIQQGRALYAQAAGTASAETVTASSSTAGAETSAVFQIPGPFSCRPRLGSRMLVRNNFGSALSALCGDLSSWQSGPRAMSAKLLMVNLVLAESAAERHLQALLPALCASVRDEAAASAVTDCAAVLGCHCDLQIIITLLAPRLSDALDADPRRQADALLVLASVLRGAGPLGHVQGHSAQLLQLLAQPGIADSQDSNMKAAATAVMQQLLRPGVVQQVTAAEPSVPQQDKQMLQQGHAARLPAPQDSNKLSSMQETSSFLVGLVHVLLQLAACEAPHLGPGPTAAADTAEAAKQAQHIEQLLQQVADAAGYASVDDLLGVCREQLVKQICPQLDLHSAAAVSVVSRLMLPSSCSWITTASAAATARSRQPITSPPNHSQWYSDRTSNSSTNSSTSYGFAATAETHCQPDQLITLLQLVAAAEQTYGQHLQHSPAAVHLLQLTLDCCMAVWPAAAFSQAVLEQLLGQTVPVLLNSSHSLAVMAGLRSLHHALIRDVLGSAGPMHALHGLGVSATEEQSQLPYSGPHGLLAQAWRQEICTQTCRLLESNVTAVRLEVCYLLQHIVQVLGCQSALQQVQQQEGNVAHSAAPQPVAALYAALDDADVDVRAAAGQVLEEMLQELSQSGQGLPKAAWVEQVQERLVVA